MFLHEVLTFGNLIYTYTLNLHTQKTDFSERGLAQRAKKYQ